MPWGDVDLDEMQVDGREEGWTGECLEDELQVDHHAQGYLPQMVHQPQAS